jgi:hypothetical protein
MPGPSTPRRAAALAAALGGVIWVALPARAERVELDLYEKISLAPLVVRARLDSAPQRLARMQVLEVIKGEYAAPSLEIVYRLANFERDYGAEKISFEEGEEYLLFLLPAEDWRGRRVDPQRHILFKGPDGSVALPAEGRQVWTDAARRLAPIASLSDSRELFPALAGLLREENPILLQIGLRQARKHRLESEGLAAAVLELVRRADGPFRAEALELAAELVEKPSRGGQTLALRDHLVGIATAIADEAPEPSVRRAAVRLLASDATPAARAKLEAISEHDPSQDVRYEAALAIYRLRQAAPVFGQP